MSLALAATAVLAGPAAAIRMPLVFETNRGQADPYVRFLARSQDSTLFLMNDGGATLTLPEAGGVRHSIRMRLDGALPNPAAEGAGAHGASSYYLGSNPARWRSSVPTWDKAIYQDVYPGVDLVYYATAERNLELDFVVAPGADASAIALRFEGLSDLADDREIAVDGEGHLRLATPAGEVTLEAPRIYQDIAGERRLVAGRYQPMGDGRIRFEVGEHDAGRPLVIDPILRYSSFIGGSATDFVENAAVDKDGNFLITGQTASTDFPLVSPAFSVYSGEWDAFVAKVSPDGSQLLFSTYLGSASYDQPTGIDTDAAGNVYISGWVFGSNFPVLNAFQPIFGGLSDIFLTKLSPTGTLLYSTYVGGSFYDTPSGWPWGANIEVMADGRAYITGSTGSTDFPQLNGAQPTLNTAGSCIWFADEVAPCGDMVVSVFSPTGGLLYSTFWGGPEDEGAGAIAVDSTGAAYVLTGGGSPTTPLVNPFQPVQAGNGDLFIMKIRPDGSQPVYATYLGGSDADWPWDIEVDGENAPYILATTRSHDIPIPHGFQATLHFQNWYLARINPRGTGVDYATYHGGIGFDNARGLAVDDVMGNVAMTGYSLNEPFPVLRPMFPGVQNDGFVARVHPTGPTLLYSTPMGGGHGHGIGFDSRADVYVGGFTDSADFALLNPFQPLLASPEDAFVRRIADGLATLSTPSRIPASPGDTVTVPVRFTPGGFNIAFTALSVDYDESCLTFDPTDANADGIPDSIVFTLPAGFSKTASFSAADTDGEIDISIFDPSPPFVLLPLGTVANITFGVQAGCGVPAPSTMVRVGFSTAPQVSFGNTSGQSEPGLSLDGSIQVFSGLRGDCNGDQSVDAGDLGASVLEYFDTDGSFWIDAPLSTFAGSPAGCDANGDESINAADLSCTVLLIFQGPGACTSRPAGGVSVRPPVLALQTTRAPVGPGGEVRLPVNFTQGAKTTVNSVGFSLALPPSMTFDPTDADEDGIPDAVSFRLPAGFVGSVQWTPQNRAGQLAFLIYDTTGKGNPLPKTSTLAVVTLIQSATVTQPVRFGTAPAASFGETGGNAVAGETRN